MFCRFIKIREKKKVTPRTGYGMPSNENITNQIKNWEKQLVILNLQHYKETPNMHRRNSANMYTKPRTLKTKYTHRTGNEVPLTSWHQIGTRGGGTMPLLAEDQKHLGRMGHLNLFSNW
jgi:hypothetical protein